MYPPGAEEELAGLRVFAWWNRSVPARIQRSARPVRLRRGVLHVNTSTSAWAAELDFMREQLLSTLRAEVPGCAVRDIRFRVGPLPERPAPRDERPPAPPIVPAAELPEELARELARVGDDEVRDAVARAAGTSLGRRPT